MKAGEAIASALVIAGVHTIHFEMYKVIGNDHYNKNPTSLLPTQDPTVSIEWKCNEIVTMVQGVVVQNDPIITKNVQKVLIGDPLVNIQVPEHEFPQPYDMLLEESREISNNNVQFFRSSTTLVVGPLPVTLCTFPIKL